MGKKKQSDKQKFNIPNAQKVNKSLTKNPNTNAVNISINFSDFQHYSIKTKHFNNCFIDCNEYIKVTRCAIEKLKYISQFTHIGMLLSQGNLHIHPIDDDAHISLIKKVLKEYKFNVNRIDELFDDKIYQIQIAEGSPASRLVFYIIGNSVLCPLFIDVNHQIYKSDTKKYDINLDARKYNLKQQ